jgi:hypothetical protein
LCIVPDDQARQRAGPAWQSDTGSALNSGDDLHFLVGISQLGSKIIDVSTDGVNTTGANPVTASATAFASGIAVNCLGVGGSADCSFNNGYGVDFLAGGFAEFEAAIRAKLSVELTKTPEPMTLTLFGAGLVGAGFTRRRMKKA